MPTANLRDTTLLILAHGSTMNDGSEVAARVHADALDARHRFAAVQACYWKQPPYLRDAAAEIRTRRVVVVPFFTGPGYFVEVVIPEALGLRRPGSTDFVRVQQRDGRWWHYAQPVGSHPQVTDALLARAREVVTAYSCPPVPAPEDCALVIAGHGTERSARSRGAVEAQVETIRSRGLYAGVHPAFLEEEPRIADCIRAATGSRVVVVPFFMSDGLHVVEDIPVLLGEPREQVESRHRAGQPTWQNPANRNGKQVWYAGAVGSHPSIVNLIEQRALDAVGAVPAASTERATATVGGETALPPGQGG